MVYAERNMVFGKMLAELMTRKSRFMVVYDKEQSSEENQVMLWKAVDEDVCGEVTYPMSFVKEFTYDNMSIVQIADYVIREIEECIAASAVQAKQLEGVLENLRVAVLYKEDYVEDNEESEFAVVVVNDEEDEDAEGSELFATVVLLNEDGSDYNVVTKETVDEWGLDVDFVERVAFANSEEEEFLVDTIFVNRATIEFLDDLEDYSEELLGLDDDDDKDDNEADAADGQKTED